jgi:phage terminase large subunit
VGRRHIVERVKFALPFTPRAWQRPLMDDKAPRIVAVVHRRAGKSHGLMWRGLRKAGTLPRSNPPPRVVHTLPYSVQWERTGLWDVFERAVQSWPGAQIKRSERRAVLPNGGIYQAGGMDNPDSWRGGYADEFIEDEADDIGGSGLETVIEPMLSDYAGVRIKAGTPKGLGRLREAYDRAGGLPDWSRYLLRWQDTGVVGAIDRAVNPDGHGAAIARLRSEMTEEEFAQEMECSWEAPNSGAIFGKQMRAARAEGRIRAVPYDPALPVTTAWDLGINDFTCIWFAQITRSGEWRIIDFEAGQGEALGHYVQRLKERGYVYGTHILPHDVEVRELQSGKSRRSFLEGLGVRPIKTLPAANPSERDAQSRRIIPKCFFDETRTAQGVRMLEAYRREFNEKLGVFRAEPVHDDASHAADSFGHLCQGAREPVERRLLATASPQWNW